MTLQQFLLILRARWMIALLAFALTVATTVAVSLYLPKQYTANAAVVIDVKSPDALNGMVMGGNPASYMATQVDIINSDRVARAVVRNLRAGGFVRLRLKNMVLTLLTLGFYRPFARVSEYRMKLESVTLHIKGGADQVAGALVRQQSAHSCPGGGWRALLHAGAAAGYGRAGRQLPPAVQLRCRTRPVRRAGWRYPSGPGGLNCRCRTAAEARMAC